MDVKKVIRQLEREWDVEPPGFFWRLRDGYFEGDKYERLLGVLRSIDSWESDLPIDSRLVSLLWFIPAFIENQRVRVVEIGGDLKSYEPAVGTIAGENERILGMP